MTQAGWYPDPQNGAFLRWWDGLRWTPHTRARPPLPAPSVVQVAVPPAPAIVNQPPQAPVVAMPSVEEVARLRAEYDELRARVVELRNVEMLEEVGIYQYAHPLDSAAAYKDRLAGIAARIVSMVKAGDAVKGAANWSVNGSAQEGGRMVTDFCKLMLRAYNNEADNAVRSMKPYALAAAIKRLEQSRATISKLGLRMQIHVTEGYHALRLEELKLTADYLSKVAEEKEREREERARLREEEAVRKEFERETAKLQKEKSHYESAIDALRAKGDLAAVATAELKLAEIDDAIRGVTKRLANVRAGYVYVISNIGAFGETVVKIGMTRRLEPMDRVRELGDASVPFRFDVHAMIFSDDAVGLETALHQQFAKQRVNLVNAHREFFFVSPVDVRDALSRHVANLLTFVEAPEAIEWHQSNATRGSSLAVASPRHETSASSLVDEARLPPPASVARPTDLPPPMPAGGQIGA